MYQDTAYNTENLIEQCEGEALGYWTKKLNSGKKLSHIKASGDISIGVVKSYLPSEDFFHLRDDAIKEGDDDAKEMFWTEEVLSQQAFSPFTQFYLLIVGISKVYSWITLPIFTIMITLQIINTDQGERVSQFIDSLSFFYYFILSCVLIYGYHILTCKDGFEWLMPPFMKINELYSLNRQTGMVTLYKKGKKVRFSHPFAEFDCYFISSPTVQGHRNTALFLLHRYNNYRVGIPLHLLLGSDQDVQEYNVLWNMIQRYMDVSQPLPDCIILEESRERDPVTAVYDKVTGRNPRYWRDMTDEEYLTALDKLDKSQKEDTKPLPLIDIIKGEVLDAPKLEIKTPYKPPKHPKNRYKHRKRK